MSGPRRASEEAGRLRASYVKWAKGHSVRSKVGPLHASLNVRQLVYNLGRDGWKALFELGTSRASQLERDGLRVATDEGFEAVWAKSDPHLLDPFIKPFLVSAATRLRQWDQETDRRSVTPQSEQIEGIGALALRLANAIGRDYGAGSVEEFKDLFRKACWLSDAEFDSLVGELPKRSKAGELLGTSDARGGDRVIRLHTPTGSSTLFSTEIEAKLRRLHKLSVAYRPGRLSGDSIFAQALNFRKKGSGRSARRTFLARAVSQDVELIFGVQSTSLVTAVCRALLDDPGLEPRLIRAMISKAAKNPRKSRERFTPRKS